MINKFTFGSFIREKRLEKEMTQKELSEILLLSESAISKWEIGKSYPDITLVPEICKALDISEHELIRGANDTEYRKMQEHARLYKRISETSFWGFTGTYIAALIICIVCDLAVNKGFTFSPIVFGSLIVAFTFIPTCIRFTKKHKFALFTGSTYLSLVVLFTICCIKFEQNWLGIAITATLLGYVVFFLPFLIKQYLPIKYRKCNVAIYFAISFIFIFILLLITRITVQYDLYIGVLILLFSWIPFTVFSIMHVLKTNSYIKAAIDILFATLTLYGSPYCINKILGYNAVADYQINFYDWYNYTNGNVLILILITGMILFSIFMIIGKKHTIGRVC